MTTHGYMMFTFRVHPFGAKKSPLPLGRLGHDEPVSTDAAVLLHGILQGLVGMEITESHRHLTVISVESPRGRCIRFKVDVGKSGEEATFRDPTKPGEVAFERRRHHVDTSEHRGLLVLPTGASDGILVLQARDRRSGHQQLGPVLKRVLRRVTGGQILDLDALVHEEMLKRVISEAEVNEVTLKRRGLTSDVADALDVGEGEEDLGNMKLVISRGRIPKFKQSIISKFRTSTDAQDRLLQVGGLDFNEMNVAMQVGSRRTTLSVKANKLPAFVYQLDGEPDDALFYDEVEAMVKEAAPCLGILLGSEWNTKPWSDESIAAVVKVLPTEVSQDGDGPD